MKKKNWKKGDMVTVRKAGNGMPAIKGTVTGERCWQCRKVSVVNYTTGLGKAEACLHDCGPRALCNMFRF